MASETSKATLVGAIAVIVTLFLACVGGAYKLGQGANATLKDQLVQYEKSNEWNLPENLKRLGEVSDKLSLTLDERKEFEQNRTEITDLRTQMATKDADLKLGKEKLQVAEKRVAELEVSQADYDKVKAENQVKNQELQACKASKESAEGRLREYEGEVFWVEKGQSHVIVPNKLLVGVSDCMEFLFQADVQFGEKEYENIKPGAVLKASIDGKTYSVALRAVSNTRCQFSTWQGGVQAVVEVQQAATQ